MSVGGEMHLVLDSLKELLRGFCPWVIVYAEGINLQNLAVEDLFRGADVPDTCQEFIKVVAATCAFQEVIVHGKAFDQVLAQYLCGPNAELHAPMGIDSVADTDDNIEVVVCNAAFYFPVSFVLNCCKKRNSDLLRWNSSAI